MIAAALVPPGSAAAQMIEPIDYQRIPSDIKPLDRFGSGVRMSGNTNFVIAGAFRHDVPGTQTTDSGAAYIYERDGDVWNEVQKLRADPAENFEYFGTSVAIEGGVAVVSVPGHFLGVGRVDVFHRDVGQPSGDQWEFEQSLGNPGNDALDQFGGADGAHEAVATDGSYIVVGARNAEAGNEDGAGKVYIWLYDSQQEKWEFDTTLTSDNPQEDAHFGHSVAIDGRYVVVGAPMTGGGIGAVYIFYRDDFGNWSLEQRLPGNVVTPQPPPDMRFGWSVAIDGQIIVAGAPGANSAHTFRWDTGTSTWKTLGKLEAEASDPDAEFGTSVSVVRGFKDHVLVGAPNEPYPGAADVRAGAVYLFERSDFTPSGRWSLERRIIQYPELANDLDRFGAVVSIAGGEWAISAIGDSAPDACNDPSPGPACTYYYGAIYLKGDSPLPPCGEECAGDLCCACGPLIVTSFASCDTDPPDPTVPCFYHGPCYWVVPLDECEGGVATWKIDENNYVKLNLNTGEWQREGFWCPCRDPYIECELPGVCDPQPSSTCNLFQFAYAGDPCFIVFEAYCPGCSCVEDEECVPCE